MSFVGSNILAGASGSQGGAGYEIERSLRFNQGDSPSLSKSFGSAGNRKKWTWSGWFKRGSESQPGRFFSAGADATNRTNIFLYPRSSLLGIGFYSYVGGVLVGQAGSVPVLADHSAWYHLVFAFDAANSTTADRLKIYINGVQHSITYTVNVSNIDHYVNSNTAHYVGRGADGYSFDGYLADVHFIDGQALAATDFGEYDSKNVWQPKAYSGTYGTNGFHLDFSDNTSTTTIAEDSSGNNNDFTANNISVSTGGPTSVTAASGALPIYNTTDTYGTVKGSGLRSDSNASSLSVCVPLQGSNGGTTFTDESPTGRTSGTKTFTRSGDTQTSTSQSKFYGSSGYFDGTGDYLTSSATGTDMTVGTGAFTLEYWGYFNTFSSSPIVLSAGTGGFSFGVNSSGNPLMYRNGAGGWGASWNTATLSTGQWYHLAAVKSSGSALWEVFVNGVSHGTKSGWGGEGTTSPLYIGGYGNGVGSQLPNAYIADIRIYKGVAKYTSNFSIVATSSDPTIAAGNDSLIDTPTNATTPTDTGAGNEVVGNYCTVNPLDSSGTNTVTNGNLQYATGATFGLNRCTLSVSSGKWYWEVSEVSGIPGVGVSRVDVAVTNAGHTTANGWAYFGDTGNKWNNNVGTAYGASFSGADVIGVALDMDNGTLTFYKNGVSQGVAFNTGLSGYTLSPMLTSGLNVSGGTFNFGQRAFAYTAPSGYKALCTTNLPDPTIADGSTAMDVLTWTGDGTDDRNITGLGFSPDFSWMKSRSGTFDHRLSNSIITTHRLISNTTGAEVSNFGEFSLLSNGIQVSASVNDNNTSETYVAWNWDGGHPATASTGAVSFDGTGDYLTTTMGASDTFGTGDFTVELFVNPNSVALSDIIDTRPGSDNSNAWAIQYDGTDLHWTGDGTNSLSVPVANTPIGAWTHLAYTRESGTMKVFINGVQYGSSASKTNDYTQTRFDIGVAVRTYYFNGFISNLHIVKGTALYTSNFTPPSTELTNVTNTKLLCCQSNTLPGGYTVSPISGGLNDGTIWSSLVSAPSGFESTYQAELMFNGDTSGTSDVVPAQGDRWTLTHNFGSVTTLKYFTYFPSGNTANGANAFEVNGVTVTPTSKTQGGWTTLPIAGGTLTSFGSKYTGAGDYVFVSAIEVDGTVLLDPIRVFGESKATTFNPLDIFTVNGAGYSTTSAAGITEGTIPLTGASVNRSTGFSVITADSLTANTEYSIGHSLNAVPQFIIGKNRAQASQWDTYHVDVGAGQLLRLNSTGAAIAAGGSDSNFSTTPTSSVFYFKANGATNNYVFYCFAPVEGYSAFGSYTGNGSADGPFVFTGFRPALVIIKCSSTSNAYTNWDINDSVRDTYNVADATLAANLSDAENSVNIGTQHIDFLSNGFKIRQASSSSKNLSGATYVYAAFAVNPFKTARAR